MSEPCPFCDILEPVLENRLALARFDKYPVSPGHLLVVPRRHMENYFELSAEEKTDMWILVDRGKKMLDREHNPSGYNVGINCGVAAGQTVMHAHIHVIPRFDGDVDDPRGGLRKLFPGKADYWSE
jgi:diadenosine tetraphosphate (Ap4A) HIT family hydrolase